MSWRSKTRGREINWEAVVVLQMKNKIKMVVDYSNGRVMESSKMTSHSWNVINISKFSFFGISLVGIRIEPTIFCLLPPYAKQA